MLSRVCVMVLAVGLMGMAGCAPKVSTTFEETLTSSKNEAEYEIPKVSSDRTIVVDVKSTDMEVDIYVVKKEDAENFVGLAYDKRAGKAIGAKQKIKEGQLETMVPANTESTVIIMRCEDKGVERKTTKISGKITSK